MEFPNHYSQSYRNGYKYFRNILQDNVKILKSMYAYVVGDYMQLSIYIDREINWFWQSIIIYSVLYRSTQWFVLVEHLFGMTAYPPQKLRINCKNKLAFSLLHVTSNFLNAETLIPIVFGGENTSLKVRKKAS